MTTTIATPAQTALSGSVLVLIQFDVCEEIRLDRLQQTVKARTVPQPNQAFGARPMCVTSGRRSPSRSIPSC